MSRKRAIPEFRETLASMQMKALQARLASSAAPRSSGTEAEERLRTALREIAASQSDGAGMRAIARAALSAPSGTSEPRFVDGLATGATSDLGVGWASGTTETGARDPDERVKLGFRLGVAAAARAVEARIARPGLGTMEAIADRVATADAIRDLASPSSRGDAETEPIWTTAECPTCGTEIEGIRVLPAAALPATPTTETGARLDLMRRAAEFWRSMARGDTTSQWKGEARRALEMCGGSLLQMLTIPESEVALRLSLPDHSPGERGDATRAPVHGPDVSCCDPGCPSPECDGLVHASGDTTRARPPWEPSSPVRLTTGEVTRLAAEGRALRDDLRKRLAAPTPGAETRTEGVPTTLPVPRDRLIGIVSGGRVAHIAVSSQTVEPWASRSATSLCGIATWFVAAGGSRICQACSRVWAAQPVPRPGEWTVLARLAGRERRPAPRDPLAAVRGEIKGRPRCRVARPQRADRARLHRRGAAPDGRDPARRGGVHARQERGARADRSVGTVPREPLPRPLALGRPGGRPQQQRRKEFAMTVQFPAGKYYACNDPETLTHEAPEEAIEEYLDADLNPRMTAAEVVASIRARPITVTAYEPTVVSDKQIESWADRLLETLGDNFSEEHGNPDDGPCDGFPADAEQVMREAVRSIIRRSHLWACGEVGKVALSPDEIEAVMRTHRPDWFSDPAPSHPAAERLVGEDRTAPRLSRCTVFVPAPSRAPEGGKDAP